MNDRGSPRPAGASLASAPAPDGAVNAAAMANALRFLAINAVPRAGSGHPGMPMGMADRDGRVLGIDGFGLSGKRADVVRHFGFHIERVSAEMRAMMGREGPGA